MTDIEILKPGIFTTIQDVVGRKGMRKYGIPVGGALDAHSAKLANWLVGNTFETPVLEITLGGFKAKFSGEAVVGLSGGKADIKANGNTVQMNTSLRLSKDSCIEIGNISRGCRIYLAIGGCWKVPKVLGSYGTCASANIGGYNGRKLKNGDVLGVNAKTKKRIDRKIEDKLVPYFSKNQQIRVIKGPEWEYLPDKEKDKILENKYGIQSSSNRMGIRLKGGNPAKIKIQNYRSSPVIPGIVQLPPNGAPIVLMQDAQSVGGYPRILKVIDADLWRLGQVWIGNKINFCLVGREEAIKLFHYYKDLRESLIK